MMKVKNMRKIIMGGLGAMLLVMLGCAKLDTDFKDFFNGAEVVYTGAVGKVTISPGNQRTQLKWKSSPDGTIVKYVVYWNEKQDSLVIPITTKTDSVTALITGLNEYSYTFTIHSFDAKGNKSIPVHVNNVKVYGTGYINGLLNRAINVDKPYLSYTASATVLNFLEPDTINVTTRIRYENLSGQQVEVSLKPTVSTIELPNYKLGSTILYKSSYIPERNAIDVFDVREFSVFPDFIPEELECDKSLFRELRLPFDVETLDESPLRNLWDGKREAEGYPNIYHSRDNMSIPHTLTFDMGKVYSNLTKFEEIGRSCCHNPVEFEVWGIEAVNNAATSVAGDHGDWKKEMVEKGWTLLADVKRNDDGVAPMTFKIKDNPPAVRYIRMRIKKTANNEARQSNMSEITFWNK